MERKEEKQSFFTDAIQTQKTQKNLQINYWNYEFDEVAGQKINTLKSIAFIYTSPQRANGL